MAEEICARDSSAYERGVGFFDAVYGFALTLLVTTIDSPGHRGSSMNVRISRRSAPTEVRRLVAGRPTISRPTVRQSRGSSAYILVVILSLFS